MTTELHPDLIANDRASTAVPWFGTLALGVGAFFGWLVWGIVHGMMKDPPHGLGWINWDFILGFGFLVASVALTIVCVAGGFFAFYFWWGSLSGELEPKELEWRKLATSVQATTPAQPCSLRLVKSTRGGGIHGGWKTTEYQLSLVSIGHPSTHFPEMSLVVHQVAMLPSFQQMSSKPRSVDAFSSEFLLGNLIKRNPTLSRFEQVPSQRLGTRETVAPLLGKVKIADDTTHAIAIIECDGLRIWCSGGPAAEHGSRRED